MPESCIYSQSMMVIAFMPYEKGQIMEKTQSRKILANAVDKYCRKIFVSDNKKYYNFLIF